MNILEKIMEEFSLTREHTENSISLIDDGNTVPFIARYRKEMTGHIDDQVLRSLLDRLTYLRNLEKRKQEVEKSITEQGKLTEEISLQLASAETLTESLSVVNTENESLVEESVTEDENSEVSSDVPKVELGKEKKKKLRSKEKEKAHKEKTPCRLASYSWLHEKGQKPFPFCRWYTTVWFLSRLTILNITIERLGISSGSIVTSRAITSSTLLKPTSVSSATFCPL